MGPAVQALRLPLAVGSGAHNNPNPSLNLAPSPTPVPIPVPVHLPAATRRRRGSDEDSMVRRLGAFYSDDEDILLDRRANELFEAGSDAKGAGTVVPMPSPALATGTHSPLRNSWVLDEDAVTSEARSGSLGPEMQRLLEQYVNKSDSEGRNGDEDDNAGGDGKSLASSSSSTSSKHSSLQVQYLHGMLDGAVEDQEYVWVELPLIKEEGDNGGGTDAEGDEGSSSSGSSPDESIAYMYGRIDQELLSWSPLAPKDVPPRQE